MLPSVLAWRLENLRPAVIIGAKSLPVFKYNIFHFIEFQREGSDKCDWTPLLVAHTIFTGFISPTSSIL